MLPWPLPLRVPSPPPEQQLLLPWFAVAAGEPRSRGMQLWRALYHSWPLLEDLRPTIGTPNGFSAAFVDRLTRVASLGGGMEVAGVSTAPDGTQKLACRLTTGPAAGMEVSAAGLGLRRLSGCVLDFTCAWRDAWVGERPPPSSLPCQQVECVLIPMPGSKPRTTVCISSQVGCAQNCQVRFVQGFGSDVGTRLPPWGLGGQPCAARQAVHFPSAPPVIPPPRPQFCFTGRMGLLGQLSPAQIVQQVVLAKRQARPGGVAKPPDPSSGPEVPVTNVVFMGMVSLEPGNTSVDCNRMHCDGGVAVRPRRSGHACGYRRLH